jgi:3-hydroxyisobutyrate dehydrogenase-like beta-hydroxyacid dehydrogenase
VIDTSTVGPEASAKAAAALKTYLRAPVSGSVTLAESGQLTTFVSGPRAAFDAAAQAFKAYTRAQFWVGEGEEARYAKLAINLMVAVTTGMMKEALALGTKGGIGWEQMLELIGESVVGSPLVKYKSPPLLRDDYSAKFTTAMMLNDVELVLDLARERDVALPFTAQLRTLLERTAEGGYADADFMALYAQLRQTVAGESIATGTR